MSAHREPSDEPAVVDMEQRDRRWLGGLGVEPVCKGEQPCTHRRRLLCGQVRETAVFAAAPRGHDTHLGQAEHSGDERRDDVHGLDARQRDAHRLPPDEAALDAQVGALDAPPGNRP